MTIASGSFVLSLCALFFAGSTPFLGLFICCLHKKASNLAWIVVVPNFSNSSATCLTASCSGNPCLMRAWSACGKCCFLDKSDLPDCLADPFPLPRHVNSPLLLLSRSKLLTLAYSPPYCHSLHIVATLSPLNNLLPPVSSPCLCCAPNLAQTYGFSSRQC